MNKAEKQVTMASLRDEATVIRQTRENYKEARANIEDKLKVLSEREQTQSVIWQKQYQEALKQQLDTAIDALSTKNYANIRQYLEGEYENGFIGTMYSLQKQGIPLAMPIDQRRVAKMVETGADQIKLSKRLYGNATKLKNAVRREVSIGFASGESYQDVAARLSRTMEIDYNKAIRIARTEGGRVQNASRYEASVEAKKCGADIVKQWDSTLDARTRTAHRELDGQVQELDEPFKAEGQEAQHPHGFGVPWMDVNCRCVMLQRARWAVEGEGYEDYTKYSRFAEFEREKWISGELDSTVQKHGGQIIDLSDAKNFSDFKQRYKVVSNNLIAQAAATAIGVEVMGNAVKTINRDAAVYSTLELEHVNAIATIVENAEGKQVVEVYTKFENRLVLLDGKYKRGAHYNGNGVNMNVQATFDDAKRSKMGTWFHEFGHHIDDLSGKNHRYASIAYKDNLFGKTLAKEVDDLTKQRQKEIKAAWTRAAEEKDFDWMRSQTTSTWVKWEIDKLEEQGLTPAEIKKSSLFKGQTKKSAAFSSIEKELYELPDIERCDISDIMEGATGAKIQAGWGHGASYWKNHDYFGKYHGLAKEAFAEYFSAYTANPKSLAILKKYLPESTKVFDEIIEAILKEEI